MISERLINLVCSKPELWDQSNKSYPSKQMKQQAWQFIGEQLNLPANEAKIRWTNLRDLFRRELKKTVNMAKMTGDPESYVPRWRHFRSMLFLRDQIVKDCEDLELPALAYDESKQAEYAAVKDEDCIEMEDEFYGEYSPNASPSFIDVSEAPQTSGRKRGSKNRNGYDGNSYQKSGKRQHAPENSGYADAVEVYQALGKRQHVPENPGYVDAVEVYQSLGRRQQHASGNSVYADAVDSYSAPLTEFNGMDEDYHFVMSILGSVRRIRPDRKMAFKLKVLQLIVDEENCLLEK